MIFHRRIRKCWPGVLLLLLCSNAVHAQLNVFACEPEWAALTEALGGDAVKVYSATSAEQDPHHIQARPSLIAKVRRADLLVCTGADLEVGWLPLLLRKSGNGDIQANQPGFFMAADQVSLLEAPAVLDRSLGDIHAAGNPHIHLDPYRLQQIAIALAATLGKVDPTNNDLYQANLGRFTHEWRQAITRWEMQAEALRGRRIVVSHNNWVYLEQWLGLERAAVLEAKPGVAPSSRHLAQLLVQLKLSPADMILNANYQNDQSARWLAQKTGLPIASLPFSVADEETLIQWFDRLLSQLLSADS